MKSVFQCDKCNKIMQIDQKNVEKAPKGKIEASCITGKTFDLYKCTCGATKKLLSGWRVHHKPYEGA